MKKFKVYDSKTIRMIEENTAEQLNISINDLVYSAGKHLYEAIISQKLISINDSILILFGYGNNGADALVVGSYLKRNNYHVTFCGTSESQNELQQKIIKESLIEFTHINSHTLDLNQYDVIIDGIFGIGLDRILEIKDREMIEKINQTRSKKISIDIPSGIHPNSGLKMGNAIIADYTLICHTYKRGNLLSDAKDHHGKMILVDMGFIEPKMHHEHLVTMDRNELIFPKRKEHSHKYSFGHLLVLGGSISMLGAPILSSHASLKTGAGLVTWALDEKLMHIPTQQWPDVIKAYIKDKPSVLDICYKKDAIIFGMGLGKEASILSSSLNDLINQKIPILIDADGISIYKSLDHSKIDESHVVLTPHLMELSRLIQTDIEEIKKNPIQTLMNLSSKSYIILKGPCTVLKHENEIYYFSIGNSGMAKAGFGDVLSGIIGTLLMSHPILDAIFKGLFIFHYAGIITKETEGEYSMTASNLIENITKIIHKEISYGK